MTYSSDGVSLALNIKKILSVLYWLGNTAIWDDVSFSRCLAEANILGKLNSLFERHLYISIYCLKYWSRGSTDDSQFLLTVAFSYLLIKVVIYYSSHCWIPSGCYYEGIWLLCCTAGPVFGDIFFSLLKYQVTTIMVKWLDCTWSNCTYFFLMHKNEAAVGKKN